MRASRCTSTCTNSPGCPTHSGAPPALARVVLALRRSFTRGLLSEGTERVVTPLSCHSLCGAIECCSRHHRIAQQPKIRVGRHSRTSHRAPIVASQRNSIALGPRLERLRHLCSVGSPARRGEATAVWQGLRFGSSPRKNDSSARALTMTAAADLIRATVHNRVDNQVRGASLANHRHRRSDHSRAVLPAVACRGATSRFAPATPSSLRRPCGGLTGRTGQLVTDTIPSCLRSIQGDKGARCGAQEAFNLANASSSGLKFAS